MSVLSRTPRTSRTSHEQPEHVGVPQQRPSLPASAASMSARRRAAGLAMAGVVVLGAAGTATWVLLDDGTTAAPVSTTVELSETELQRDRSMERRSDLGTLVDDRMRRELQRDIARARAFAR